MYHWPLWTHKVCAQIHWIHAQPRCIIGLFKLTRFVWNMSHCCIGLCETQYNTVRWWHCLDLSGHCFPFSCQHVQHLKTKLKWFYMNEFFSYWRVMSWEKISSIFLLKLRASFPDILRAFLESLFYSCLKFWRTNFFHVKIFYVSKKILYGVKFCQVVCWIFIKKI